MNVFLNMLIPFFTMGVLNLQIYKEINRPGIASTPATAQPGGGDAASRHSSISFSQRNSVVVNNNQTVATTTGSNNSSNPLLLRVEAASVWNPELNNDNAASGRNGSNSLASPAIEVVAYSNNGRPPRLSPATDTLAGDLELRRSCGKLLRKREVQRKKATWQFCFVDCCWRLVVHVLHKLGLMKLHEDSFSLQVRMTRASIIITVMFLVCHAPRSIVNVMEIFIDRKSFPVVSKTLYQST